MRIADIKRIAVVGAGTMGVGIAQVFAQSGYNVTINDVNQAALKYAKSKIKASVTTLLDRNLLTREEADKILPRIQFVKNLAPAVREADFIVEAIGEDLQLKRDLFKRLDNLSPRHAILASNSSTLSIDEMAQGTKRPVKLILTHFINPPQVIPLVEVARGSKTSQETLSLTLKLLKNAGKRPLVCHKIIPGYLINTFNSAIMFAALNLLSMGVASMEDIDRAFTEALGPRYSVMGPFKTMDLFGLDIIWQGVKSFDADAHNNPTIASVRKLVEAGNYGMKTGKGFYNYSMKSPDEVMQDINGRLLNMLQAAINSKEVKFRHKV